MVQFLDDTEGSRRAPSHGCYKVATRWLHLKPKHPVHPVDKSPAARPSSEVWKTQTQISCQRVNPYAAPMAAPLATQVSPSKMKDWVKRTKKEHFTAHDEEKVRSIAKGHQRLCSVNGKMTTDRTQEPSHKVFVQCKLREHDSDGGRATQSHPRGLVTGPNCQRDRQQCRWQPSSWS